MRYKLIIICGALFVAAVFGFQFRETWLTRGLTYTEAREGYVTHDETAPAIFARTETVLYAAGSGSLSFIVPDGTRAQKGEAVVRIDDRESQAPVAGLISSHLDGLEEILIPTALLEDDLGELFTRCGGEAEAVFSGRPGSAAPEPVGPEAASGGEARTYVRAGDAAAKIVNNLQPVWAYIATGDTQGILKGDKLSISVDGTLRSCTVERVAGPGRGLVVSFPQYISTVTNTRLKQVQWQKQAPRYGVVVPAEALFARGEEVGIYVVESGIINFRRVKVLDRNETLVCVDNLPAGYYVVTSPADGLQGLAAAGI
ncbi:MAG: hypothetical protein LBS10_03770 [Gracilibacteraceae bacterium]|jgi:hypothetical protein|nr:hypothetical protein [Gracilibacteraceae bacterium]